MRMMILASTLFAASMVAASGAALAANPCGPGKVRECRETSSTKPGVPPACRCVSRGAATGSGSYGHAEIKKKNVPTVQPNQR